jgi:hypothetical protein
LEIWCLLTDCFTELGLQRLEAQTSLVLSRQIGTPNIASKGKLFPRTVSIPSFLAGDSSVSRTTVRPLIQEVAPEATPKEHPFNKKIKGILKSDWSQKHSTPSNHKASSSRHTPTWSWSRKGDRLAIVILVPSLVGLLSIPNEYSLQHQISRFPRSLLMQLLT